MSDIINAYNRLSRKNIKTELSGAISTLYNNRAVDIYKVQVAPERQITINQWFPEDIPEALAIYYTILHIDRRIKCK